MQVSSVIRKLDETIKDVLNALSNRLTSADNFGPEGKVGQVLTSRGDDPDSLPPWYQDIPGGITGEGPPGPEGPEGREGPPGEDGDVGPVGTSGSAGIGTSGGGDEAFSIYDPRTAPVGQSVPDYELNFRTLTGWPPGWVDAAGGFPASDINITRPGALWMQSGPSDPNFRGKAYNGLIPTGEDFCLDWRPWVVGLSTNFNLMTVGINADGTGNGVFAWNGRHGGYGTGVTYAYEKYGSLSGGIVDWGANSGATQHPGFMGVRREGGTEYYGYSPDGSSWEEQPAAYLGGGQISIGIYHYASQSPGC